MFLVVTKTGYALQKPENPYLTTMFEKRGLESKCLVLAYEIAYLKRIPFPTSTIDIVKPSATLASRNIA